MEYEKYKEFLTYVNYSEITTAKILRPTTERLIKYSLLILFHLKSSVFFFSFYLKMT